MIEAGTPQPHNPEIVANADFTFFDYDEMRTWRELRFWHFGESVQAISIIPMEKSGEPHDVGLLERTWVNPQNGETIVHRHLACRCIAQCEVQGDVEMELMQQCPAWQDALTIYQLEEALAA